MSAADTNRHGDENPISGFMPGSRIGWRVRMTLQAPPPGWYSHPKDRSQQRYWNGTSWEDHYRRVPMDDPVSAESSQTPSVNESNSLQRLPGYAALSSLLTQLQQRAALLNKPADRSGPPLDKQRLNALLALGGMFLAGIAILVIGEGLGLFPDETTAGPTSAAAAPSMSTTSPSPTPTPSASESAIQEPVEPQPGEAQTAAEETLTAKNNKDLAALLAVDDYDLSEEFARKYEGKLIEFDGNIAYMANHDDYETRYDMLITAGDYSETTQTGPNFKFEDVNVVYDLHLTGSNIPDYVGMGDNLHVIARVEEFNRDMGLFFLDPVSTEVR